MRTDDLPEWIVIGVSIAGLIGLFLTRRQAYARDPNHRRVRVMLCLLFLSALISNVAEVLAWPERAVTAAKMLGGVLVVGAAAYAIIASKQRA